jgi:hypothetical protein
MKLLVIAITTALAISPASAKMIACTGENMAKLVTSSNAMPDTPGKAAMMREMGAANAAMAKGDMRGACKIFLRAQQTNERSERLDINSIRCRPGEMPASASSCSLRDGKLKPYARAHTV